MRVVVGEHLLERDHEVAALAELIGQTRDGKGRAVVIEGPAGIGKTRLLQDARETAKRAGVRVLSARGTDLERDFPFAVVRQLFEPPLRALDPAGRYALLAGAASPAAPVLGIDADDRDAAPRAVLEDPTFAWLNALYWLTSNLAESGPLLLVVDDAHWADQATLRFLRFLLPRLEDLPVLLAIAARPSGTTEAGRVDDIAADPAAHVLRPRALSYAAVATLARSQLSTAAADEFCAAMYGATKGNPFLLRELLGELEAEGSLGTADDAQHIRDLVPATIQRAVLLRLARLGAEARRLARAVAVLGDDAALPQAQALAALDAEPAALAADALAAAGVLERGHPLSFVHPLVRNAVYADVPQADRNAAHLTAARLLRAGDAEPERVAVHLLATDPGGDPDVVEVLARAGRRALDRAAHEATVAYARRALVEPAGAADRPGLLWQLIKAGVRSGDPSVLRDLEPEVLDELISDPDMFVSSAHELAMWLDAQGRIGEGLALLERAKGVAIEAQDYDLVMLFESYDQVAPPTRKTAGWELHRPHIAPDTRAERLLQVLDAWRAFCLGEPAGTVATLARAALSDGRIFQDHPPLHAVSIAIYLLLCADELDAAEEAIDRYAAAARASGSTVAIAAAQGIRGGLAAARGDLTQAEADARPAVGVLREAGLLLTFVPYLAGLIELLVERGELDAAERELAASGLNGPIPDHFFTTRLLHARSALRFAERRYVEATADVAELGRRARRDGIRTVTAFPTMALVAIELSRLGQGKSGPQLIGMGIEHARAYGAFMGLALAGLGRGNPSRALAYIYRRGARVWGTPRVIGTALHATGVVRGGEKGIALLREAVAILECSPARLEHAKALTDLGIALRRANRRSEARAPLREALRIARRGGALAVARRAHEELQATGEKLGQFTVDGVEGLTPSESRIARLAADGSTNREIAQALFLSIKTVESHLRSAYRKLDIQSRDQLARVLAEASSSPDEPGETPTRSGRALATVLFTDIVASTRRAAEVGDARWRALIERHDLLADREIARFQGRKVKSLGDGLLATFDAPANAVRCALAIRDGVAKIGVDVRAGVHAGEVDVMGTDIGGLAVHIGARVCARAGPTEVLVTKTVQDLVAGSTLQFVDKGTHTLRDVPGEWRLAAAER